MREIDTIVIHCAATRPEWMEGRPLSEKIAEIRRWHEARGFNREGYHHFIDRPGGRGRGRPDEMQGAHAKGHNRSSIGICLIGGHGSSADDSFHDHFTQAQEDALAKLLDEIQSKYPIKKIIGHNSVSNKACPGFYVPQWLAEVESIKAKESQPQPGLLDALKALFRALFPRRST